MKTRLTWLLILMLALTVFWGCSDDDSTTPDPTETAFEKMAAAGAVYISDSTPEGCPGVINATVIFENPELYTVIDIRSEELFVAGHIPGAINSSLGDLVSDLADGTIPTGKTYVVACKTGQSAGHAKIAMELLGYTDVYSLLFGMSAWNNDEMDSWSGNTADELSNPETTNNNASLTTHALPVLTESVSTVISDRVNTMLANGFKSISYEILDTVNPDDVFILNYFGQADYEGTGTAGVPGHIPGAFQFTPYTSLGVTEMLDQLPTDKTIVVYCWTGQHSSQITAYLNMLGYDAVSLLFGSNHLFHGQLTAHKWVAPDNNFALEMGYAPTEAFETISNSLLEYINDSAATGCIGKISAEALNDNLSIYQVIDFRSITDYDLGHITGAIHSELGTLRADIADGTIPDDKPFVVTCYTGQSAGHAKVALEMMGYNDCSTLLWGMSSWNSTLTDIPYWPGIIGNTLGAAETVNNNEDLEWYTYPTLSGATMDTRIDAMLSGGFKATTYSAIESSLGNYFIVNYFGLSDYMGTGTAGVPGHIEGAFQFTPYASMGIDQMLGNLPSDGTPVVVYCWSGQHSSQITAYLNMLGYDAYSLKSGSNNLFHDLLGAHNWVDTANNFTLVPSTVLVAN